MRKAISYHDDVALRRNQGLDPAWRRYRHLWISSFAVRSGPRQSSWFT